MADVNGMANGTNGLHADAMPLPTLTPDSLRVFNALLTRAGLAARLGHLFDGNRRVHDILGYKKVLTYLDFKVRYTRQHIAHRVVSAYPKATWAQPPSIDEDNKDETDTPFEAAWKTLATRLKVFAKLQRTDLLANMGSYATCLVGLRNQPILSQPARPVRDQGDVLYLAPYSEEWVTVERLEDNPASERFGQPLFYRFSFGRGTGSGGTPRLPTGTGLVHASRVIHVAEDCLDDDIFGVPRLEPIFDLLDDLLKVVGGAGEMFWQDAKRRLIFAMQADASISQAEEEKISAQVDLFVNELKSFVKVQGMDVHALSGTVASPKEHYEVFLALIAITTEIPQRILEGSERGNLASTQDEAGWLQRVTLRQVQFAEEKLVRPLVDMLIDLRAVPAPVNPYKVNWNSLQTLSEDQQATVAEKTARALSAYAGPGLANQVVPEPEFREVYLGLEPYPNVEPTLPLPIDGEL